MNHAKSYFTAESAIDLVTLPASLFLMVPSGHLRLGLFPLLMVVQVLWIVLTAVPMVVLIVIELCYKDNEGEI